MNIHRLSNKIIDNICFYINRAHFSVITIIEKLYLWLIGVKCGKGTVFRGWCVINLRDKSMISIGKNCSFNSKFCTNPIGLNHRCAISTMTPEACIEIGDAVGISSSTITSFASIKIDRNVRIGANCVISDGDFHLDDPRVGHPSPIVIEKNVWLGYGVIVKKGVTIGENSVIGMNSIVTKDIPANSVAVGAPCKVIKAI